MTSKNGVDKIFLINVILLVATGFIFFISAAMGIFAKDSELFSSIAIKQSVFGIFLGLLSCYIFSKINYKAYKKYSLPILLGSIVITALVFVPGVGSTINGAKRWISFAGFSFQPVSILNIAFVIYWASWLSFYKDKVANIKHGILPLFIMLILIGLILLKQPDTDSFAIIAFTGLLMYLIAGGKFWHVGAVIVIGAIGIGALAYQRPYLMSRFETYIDPSANSQTSGYQIQQSLIAVGSGGLTGRGIGQSGDCRRNRFHWMLDSFSIIRIFHL